MVPFPSFLPLLLLSLSLLNLQKPTTALPLSTSSRWIVDESGQRVKLACVNWPSHLDTVLAEGMGKQPVDAISNKIASMGFNCVRLTWPLFLATNDSLANLTVRQSFQSLGLAESLAAIQVNNPALVDLPLIQAFQAVVTNLGDNNIMVILDNHISKPGWCCSNFDGNGFFGDKYFDPDVWVKGLTTMATMFNGTTNVVGMSLRNELRGARQNVTDWYRYMQRGAEAVHSANPNVLVILSGLSFDTDLSYLSKKQVEVTFTGKLVFELHWYSFSDGSAWANGNPNQVCGRVATNVMRRAGFLLDQGWPLFLSEFGIDQRGTNVNDNRYFGCMLGVAAELDLDWALWALQGSYYIRERILGLEEVYGVLAWDWCKTRNSSMLQRIQAIQAPFQGPGLSDIQPYKIIFHPSTGLCVLKKSLFEPLELGPCNGSEAWTFTAEQTIALKDTLLCLKADGVRKPAKLGIICGDTNSKWELISESKMHVSTSISSNGSSLCLDVDSDGKSIVTNPCKCLSKDQSCDPESQWFKMVNSTRPTVNKNPLMELQFQVGRWKIFWDLIIKVSS
ncbi:glycosyl hydrolase 5 family protein [Cocos nucifera]|uniref:Glycosyl hydrolase 5 family protein n=1 Tax=Cocos nucifera TaxID=13894 RepID=A0A8K0NE68_COCNU|nr:glycosyl hydrolase 5 family protein [Cocos nucifera]